MNRHTSRRDRHERLLLAREAARMMAEEGISDFAEARKRAARRLGIGQRSAWPELHEVEQALNDHHALFQSESHAEELRRLRQTALEAMQLLKDFEPRLVGRVLEGSADRHTPVELHLFADSTEAVGIRLQEQRIPYRLDEIRLRLGGQPQTFPRYHFMAGDCAVELTVFPGSQLRQAPPSPLHGHPMTRAKRAEVALLLDETD